MKKLLISGIGIVGGIFVLTSAFLRPLSPITETDKEMVKEVSEKGESKTAVPTVTDFPATSQPTKEPAGISQNNAYLLMKIAMAEAEGEDTKGKALVIRVVLNRVNSSSFPDSIKKVIFQERQFSPVANGRFDRVEPDEDCQRALDMIQNDGWDESMGALYFESKSDSTWHEDNLQYLFRHGNHYFYTDREPAGE